VFESSGKDLQRDHDGRGKASKIWLKILKKQVEVFFMSCSDGVEKVFGFCKKRADKIEKNQYKTLLDNDLC
jgi:hypothetical protein